MSDFLLSLLLRFLPASILGVSTAGLISALPEIKIGLAALKTVIAKLKDSGHSEDGAVKAAFEMLAKKRDMTTLESDAWANRGLQSGQ